MPSFLDEMAMVCLEKLCQYCLLHFYPYLQLFLWRLTLREEALVASELLPRETAAYNVAHSP